MPTIVYTVYSGALLQPSVILSNVKYCILTLMWAKLYAACQTINNDRDINGNL